MELDQVFSDYLSLRLSQALERYGLVVILENTPVWSVRISAIGKEAKIQALSELSQDVLAEKQVAIELAKVIDSPFTGAKPADVLELLNCRVGCVGLNGIGQWFKLHSNNTRDSLDTFEGRNCQIVLRWVGGQSFWMYTLDDKYGIIGHADFNELLKKMREVK